MERGILRSYPRSFWVANVMELFERAAYYGLNSVLGRYLTDKTGGALGFGEDQAGFLQGIVYAATYVIPILGGALADRYGYRRMLLLAFSLLSAGYFLSGTVTAFSAIFATLLFLAVGAGLFKPIISGTIARTTDESNSALGFGIYYWMINVGALLAPFAVMWLRGISWSLVFFASSLYCALMLVPAIFLYRDPAMPASAKKLGEVLSGATVVLTDARFMLMVLLYSCFWILYFQNFGTVLWYLRDFVDAAPADRWLSWTPLRFDAEFVTIINAATIVLLQVVVSWIVSRTRPLPTMVAGMVIGSAGFLCLASSTHVGVFVLGIAVFSVGEMTAHPKYYSYIGLVAPEDKKALYMGYAFLYGVIGALIGSNVGGEAYRRLLTPVIGAAEGPAAARRFWMAFAILGVVAALGLVVYDRLFSHDTRDTRRRARSVMLFVYGLLVVVGLWFLYDAVSRFSAGERPYRMMIQTTILLAMGGGGLASLLRARREA